MLRRRERPAPADANLPSTRCQAKLHHDWGEAVERAGAEAEPAGWWQAFILRAARRSGDLRTMKAAQAEIYAYRARDPGGRTEALDVRQPGRARAACSARWASFRLKCERRTFSSMGMPARQSDLVGLSDYLAMDAASTEARLEYTAGHVFALAGASRRHVTITRNLTSLFQAALQARGCNAFSTDLRLRVSADLYYYPDVMIACGPREGSDLEETSPSLLAEVLSESTEDRDLGIKLTAYRSLPSLLAYLIVSQEERRAEVHWRPRHDEPWSHELVVGSNVLRLSVLGGLDLPLDQVYQGTGL